MKIRSNSKWLTGVHFVFDKPFPEPHLGGALMDFVQTWYKHSTPSHTDAHAIISCMSFYFADLIKN